MDRETEQSGASEATEGGDGTVTQTGWQCLCLRPKDIKVCSCPLVDDSMYTFTVDFASLGKERWRIWPRLFCRFKEEDKERRLAQKKAKAEAIRQKQEEEERVSKACT